MADYIEAFYSPARRHGSLNSLNAKPYTPEEPRRIRISVVYPTGSIAISCGPNGIRTRVATLSEPPAVSTRSRAIPFSLFRVLERRLRIPLEAGG